MNNFYIALVVVILLYQAYVAIVFKLAGSFKMWKPVIKFILKKAIIRVLIYFSLSFLITPILTAVMLIVDIVFFIYKRKKESSKNAEETDNYV